MKIARYYLYLAEIMLAHTDLGNQDISPKKAKAVLGWLRIPRELRLTIIKEMRDMRLIKRKSQSTLIITLPKGLGS